MQSFSFKSDFNENQNIERIIQERNRKLAKQQVIFSMLLLIIIAFLVWYCARKVLYTEFDGYIQTQYKDYRAVDDLYLFDQYREVGDIVIPGDTLYSYVFLNLFGIGNLESEPAVLVNERNVRLQLNVATADVNVLRVRIHELENQIDLEDNNIRFGLTDNSHKMDLQRQLAETRAELNAALRKAALLNNISNESAQAARRYGSRSTAFANEQWDIDRSLTQLYERKSSAIRYAIAQDTAIVTKLWSPPYSRVFKEEHILQLEKVSLHDSNMQIVAYVPTGDMDKVNNNTQAEVIVNDNLSFTASVLLLGARTEDLPDELRNSLSHTYTTVMVVFKPNPGQILPLWAAVDRVPVRIRIKNFDNGRRNDGSDYWYIDEDGLSEESKYYLGLIRQQVSSSRHYTRLDELTIPKTDSVAQEPADTTAAATATAAQPAADNAKQAAAASVKAEAAPAAQPDGASEQVNYIRHKIEEGETLYRLSVHYKVSIEEIVALNPGIDKKFLAGTFVRIPVKKQQ